MTVFDVSLAVGMVVGFIVSLAVRPPWETYRRYRRQVAEAAALGHSEDQVKREARRAFFRYASALRLPVIVGVAVGAAVGALVGWILSLLSL